MTLPDDRRKASPRERFRNILSADQAEDADPGTAQASRRESSEVGAEWPACNQRHLGA